MKEKIDLVKLWLKKADNDLLTAENSLKIRPEPPLDTICFHAQQCAEKYLKVFLIFQEIDFEKTHNLTDLVALAMKRDPEFRQIMEFGKTLTPYAVEIRYPGIFDEFLTIDKAREAVELARRIKKFVLPKLSIETDSHD